MSHVFSRVSKSDESALLLFLLNSVLLLLGFFGEKNMERRWGGQNIGNPSEKCTLTVNRNKLLRCMTGAVADETELKLRKLPNSARTLN